MPLPPGSLPILTQNRLCAPLCVPIAPCRFTSWTVKLTTYVSHSLDREQLENKDISVLSTIESETTVGTTLALSDEWLTGWLAGWLDGGWMNG